MIPTPLSLVSAIPALASRHISSYARKRSNAPVVCTLLAVLFSVAGSIASAQAVPENFGPVNIGTTSPVISLVFTFATADTLSTTSVLTQGATGLDFADAGSDTCVAGTAYSSGQTCTVNVTFTPRFAGNRIGAVVLEDNSGNAIATGRLQGTGVGPQINFLPGTQIAYGTFAGGPVGVAVDGNGDIFSSPSGSGEVIEMLAVNGVVPASPELGFVARGFGNTVWMTLDGGGNLYIADTMNNAVKEVLAVNGVIPPSPTIRTLGSGFTDPIGIAVDAAGNVYVTGLLDGTVKEVLAVNGTIPATPTIKTLTSSFYNPTGIAVDSLGNLFVSDETTWLVKEILAVNGSIPASPTIKTLGSGFNQPYGVAVDANENVYVADYGNNAVKEIFAASGYTTVKTLGSGFTNPGDVVMDGGGNIYVGDYGNDRVVKLDVADPPSLTFASTAVGITSPDSPKTVTIENVGNATLTLPIPSSGNNPSISANFTLNSSGSSDCPLLNPESSVPVTLAAGASCLLPISFVPSATGAATGSLVLTDNNLNAQSPSYGLQSIALNGTGAAGFSLGASPSSVTMTQGSTATSTITLTPQTGFTGNVALSASGLPSGVTATFSPVFITGTSVLTLTASSTSSLASAQSITITGTSGSITETTTLLLTVNPANFTLSTSPTSGNLNQGSSTTTTVVVTDQNGFNGGVNLSASNLPSGVTASFSPNPATGTSVLTLTANSTAPRGLWDVVVTGVSGAEVAVAPYFILTVSPPPAITLTATPASVTVAPGSSSSTSIEVGYNYPNGNATLSATGLPSGVTASFSPNPMPGTGYSSLTFAANSSATPGTYNVTVTGADGTLAATASIALTVSSPPSLTLGASPASISIEQGLSGTSTMITTVSGSFDSNVQFSVSGQPAGVSVGGPEYIAAPGSGSSTMFVSVASTVATGTYPITVTATGQGITQTTTVSLTVLQSTLPAVYFVGVYSTLAGSSGAASDVAVDKNGNVYLAEYDGGTIDEIVAVNGSVSASSPIRTLTTCTTDCSSVAVDSNGNVYFIDYETIKEILAVNGSIPDSPVITSITSNAPYPAGLVVDGNGNVYVADDYDGTVNELIAVNGTIPANPTIRLLASGLSEPEHLALDSSGNLYVSASSLVEILAVNGSIPASPTVVPLPGGAPEGNRGVAVDRSGNVYSGGYNQTNEITAVNGSIPAAPAVRVLTGAPGYAYNGVAVDKNGNVFVSDMAYGNLLEISTAGANFRQVNTGAASPAITLNFAFGAATTLGSTAVLTQGATGLDFADAGTGTCIASTPYTTGQTCTVNVTFTPKFAGTRYGAVELNDNNGNVVATAYLQGIGVGPQLNFLPGVQTTLGSGYNLPTGVTVDSSGDVFVADFDNFQVKEILAVNGSIPSSPTINTIGSGFDTPSGLAIDGIGNIYVADMGYSAVYEVLKAGGYTTVKTLGGGFLNPTAVAVDGSGNVYVADFNNNAVKEIPPGCAESTCVTTLGNGFTKPFGVVIDSSANIFVTDTGNLAVKEILAVGGYTTINTLASGFSFPEGLAIDTNGNLYVADAGNSTISKILVAGGNNTVNTLTGSFNQPSGVAVDQSGNVYVADTNNNQVAKLDSVDPPSLTFASTAVGATSTDSPQTVTVENVGNAALNFSAVSYPASFPESNSETSDCTASTTLSANQACTLTIDFSPSTAGALSGSLVLTDNNLNAPAPGAVQNISLSGTGTQATPTITWATPAAITYGTPLSATQLNATSTTAGTFTYSPAAGTVLTVGTQTLTATFTPTDTTDYTTATATVTLTVNQATPSIVWAAPATITYGTPLSTTQLNASSTVAGTFSYSPAAGTVLGAGQQTLTVTFIPTDITDYTTATATVTLTVNKATPTIAWAAPAAITYGTPLSGTQLNATSTVPGTLAYSPAAGTILNAGTQTLTVTFTPTDSTDYTTATRSVPLTVNKAVLVVTWATPAAIPYGTALSATQLDATSNAAGTYSYSPAAGTVLAVGNHTLSVTFTPSTPSNYTTTTATRTVTLTVNKATPAITWATPAAISYGTKLSGTQLDASASVAGSFVYSPASGTVLAVGNNTLKVTFTPSNTTDYTTATASVTLTVDKATPVITWAKPSAITYGTALSATQLDASSTVAGTFKYSPASGAVLSAGSQTLSVTFTPTNTTDYTTATACVTLTVNKATPTITWATPNSIKSGTPLSATQLDATSKVAGTFTYSPAAGTVLAVGNHTLTATFTPTNSTDYTTGTASVTLTVNK